MDSQAEKEKLAYKQTTEKSLPCRRRRVVNVVYSIPPPPGPQPGPPSISKKPQPLYTSSIPLSLPLPTKSSSLFLLSSIISLQVLHASKKNAPHMTHPPNIAAKLKGFPVTIQSTIATRKIVSNAATEDSTGDVRDMSIRKEPEKVAFARTEMSMYIPALPVGKEKSSRPVKWRMGIGIQRTH